MRSIAKLFGRSPFVPLQVHMDKVAECVRKARPALEAFLARDAAQVQTLADEIAELERGADDVKRDLQNQLPRGLFLAVDRGRLLEVIAVQDNIAGKAQNLGTVLTFKEQVTVPQDFQPLLWEFLDKNLEAFEAVRQILQEMDDLLEMSFGGPEAERIVEMVEHVSSLEHESDEIQHRLLKVLFAHENELTHGEFYLWTRILKQMSEFSDLSARLAHRIRTLLIVK